jgi:hypothetical protein
MTKLSIAALRAGAEEVTLSRTEATAVPLEESDLRDLLGGALKLSEARFKLASGETFANTSEKPRELAARLAKIAPSFAGIRGTTPKGIAAEFALEDLAVRALFDVDDDDSRTFHLELAATGRRGRFALRNDDQIKQMTTSRESIWTEREMRVFFAKHVFVSSEKTSEEAALLFSLPQERLNYLVSLCKQFDCAVTLSGEKLVVDFRELPQFLFYARKTGSRNAAARILAIATELAHLVHVLPLAKAAPAAVPLPTLVGCLFCRALFFRQSDTSSCLHCGAPADQALTVATIHRE